MNTLSLKTGKQYGENINEAEDVLVSRDCVRVYVWSWDGAAAIPVDGGAGGSGRSDGCGAVHFGAVVSVQY